MLEIPLSGIKKIEEIAKSSNEYVSLSQGAVRLGGIPQTIKDHVAALLKTDKTDYYESCWGLNILREKLVETLNRDHGSTLEKHNVLPTHGCIGGLSLLYLSLLNPGDEVIVPEPTYPAYITLAMAARAVPVYVSVVQRDGFELNIEAIKAATTSKTKMIVFSNPWNPLGIVVPQATIRTLLDWCEQRGIYLIVDEAYRDYAFTKDFKTALPLVTQSEWLICASTFSKNFAMSGWRIGYLAIPQRLNKALAGMQDALLNCLSNPAQFAAVYALEHPELVQQFHNLVKANCDLALDLLQPLLQQNILSVATPEGSLFLFLKTEHVDATDLCMSILHQAKVSLVPGSSFGPSGGPFLRLCYARDTEVLREGIARLVKFFM